MIFHKQMSIVHDLVGIHLACAALSNWLRRLQPYHLKRDAHFQHLPTMNLDILMYLAHVFLKDLIVLGLNSAPVFLFIECQVLLMLGIITLTFNSRIQQVMNGYVRKINF